MQQMLDDVDHSIDILSGCSVPSMRGGVPHLKSGLKHIFFRCAHKPAAHQSASCGADAPPVADS